MPGEFGWFVAFFSIVFALVCSHFRDSLPKFPAERLRKAINFLTITAPGGWIRTSGSRGNAGISLR